MPSSCRRPSATTPTRSARSAVESRWAMTITVRPSMSRVMACSTTTSVPGSRLEVASSSTSTAGSASAARASDTSCFSPAESREPRSRTSVCSPSGSSAKRSRTPMASRASSTSCVGGAGPGQPDVVEDRAVEEEPLLGHDDDPAPEASDGGVAQVDPGVAHRALGGVVEAGDELGQGGLAGAGRAHQGEPGPHGDVEVDVAQHGGAPGVGEGDAAHLDVAPGWAGRRPPRARARRRRCRAGRTAC